MLSIVKVYSHFEKTKANFVFHCLRGECIIAARKRSLGQGNIFTGVCQSFCPGLGEGAGSLSMMSLPFCMPGPMFLPGGLCFWSHVPSGAPMDRDPSRQSPTGQILPALRKETPRTETLPLDRVLPMERNTPVDRDPTVKVYQ